MARINKKHFVIFNNGGMISATTPKDWARAHQSHFPKKDFTTSKKTPTVNQIEDFLINKLNFRIIENAEIVICYEYQSI
jgi:hypothetical protein